MEGMFPPPKSMQLGAVAPATGLEIWQTIMRLSFITNARQLYKPGVGVGVGAGAGEKGVWPYCRR